MVDRVPPGNSRFLRIELGRTRLALAEAEGLAAGSVVTLDQLVDEPVDILIAGRLVARGEVLLMDGCFCVRVTQLLARRPN
jgi:flagellar motor switch protein FliN/FliY